GRADRVPDRRARQRGQHAAGRELPVGPCRGDPGDHPVLGARRRAVRAPPRAHRAHAARVGAHGPGGGGVVHNTLLVALIASGVAYGTPLLFGALGELLAERSGVLNLGVEGMMLVGAVMGFWTIERVHAGTALSLIVAVLVAALSGAAMALIHAFM